MPHRCGGKLYKGVAMGRRFRRKKAEIPPTITIGIILILLAFTILFFQTYSFAIISSRSMEPTFDIGDVVIYRDKFAHNDIKEGDIIAFKSPAEDKIVTHRVVGVTPLGYITKGDNNPSVDSDIVHRTWVRGVVVERNGEPLRIPYIGKIRFPEEKEKEKKKAKEFISYGWRVKITNAKKQCRIAKDSFSTMLKIIKMQITGIFE